MRVRVDLGDMDGTSGIREEAWINVVGPAIDLTVGTIYYPSAPSITYSHPDTWTRAMIRRGRSRLYLRSIPERVLQRILASDDWEAFAGNNPSPLSAHERMEIKSFLQRVIEEARAAPADERAAADRALAAELAMARLTTARR